MGNTEKTPANENVWYLLATAYGETRDKHSRGNLAWNDYNNQDTNKLTTDNKRIWNGWAGTNLSEGTKKNWIKKFGHKDRHKDTGIKSIGIEIFDPWTDEEKSVVKRRFESAGKTFSDVPKAPTSRERVAFRNVSFPTLLDMGQYFLDMGVIATGAVFNGNVILIHTNLGASSFKNATFHRTAYFDGARIGIGSTGDSANFEGAIFQGQAHFKGAKLSAAKFSRAEFKEPVDFEGAYFCAEPPIFNIKKLDGSINFPLNYNNWPNVDYLKDKREGTFPRTWRNAYRTLAAMANDNMLPDEEGFFIRQEFRCKRAVEKSAGGRILFWYYSFFSDYGQSVSRPLLALLFLWALGAAAFTGYLCCPVAPLHDIYGPICAGIGTSISNVFPLFGLRGPFIDSETAAKLPMSLKYLSALQTVLSLPLLFLFGLGVRNRFRLR